LLDWSAPETRLWANAKQSLYPFEKLASSPAVSEKIVLSPPVARARK